MKTLTRIGVAACGVAALTAGLAGPAQAHDDGHSSGHGSGHSSGHGTGAHSGHGTHGGASAGASVSVAVDGRTTLAFVRLGDLNDSGAHGIGTVRLRGTTVDVRLVVTGLLRRAPHAMHFHAGAQGRCPGGSADTNDDGVVSVTEGHPFYGDVVTSLTTSGDTSASSALAIDRFPTAPRGSVVYNRQFTVSTTVAAKIRQRNAVLVVHGIDSNGSGAYDGPLKSDLDPSLPMEATAPAACGKVSPLLTL
jgi:hypothetical protein